MLINVLIKLIVINILVNYSVTANVPGQRRSNDEDEDEPIVVTSAHQKTYKLHQDLPISSFINGSSPSSPTSSAAASSPSSSSSSFVKKLTTMINVATTVSPVSTSTTPRPIGRSDKGIGSSNSSNSNNSTTSPIPSLDLLTASSLVQPLTLLVLSYLTNRKVAAATSSRVGNVPMASSSNFIPSNMTSQFEPFERKSNDSETESRTIASWIGGFAKRLKRPKPPNRADNNLGSSSRIPIPYDSAPISMSSIHGPSLGPPSGHSLGPGIFQGFVPQPEGFPGPLNPDSILLPPDLMENTGIKYWLDFIEKGGTTDDLVQMGFTGGPGSRPGPVVGARPGLEGPRRPGGLPVHPQSSTIFETAGSGLDEVGFSTRRRFKGRPPNLPQGGDRHNSRYRPGRPTAGNNIQKIGYNEHSDSNENGNGNSLESHKQTEMSPRCDKFTAHICVDDFEYPEQAIVDEIYRRRDIFELMYSEVKGNVPLVDGIPRDVEESYNYDLSDDPNDDSDDSDESAGSASGDRNDVTDERSDPMYSANSNLFSKSSNGGQNDRSRSKDAAGGYICPSEVLYGKPKLARNIKGDWKVIVNAAEFTQTVRMEKCLRPNQRCNYLSNQAGLVTRCAQVNSFHRLMVFEKGKGFYIDTFRIPTACSCHVRKTGSHGLPGSNVPNPMSELLGLNGLQGGNNGNGAMNIGKTPSPVQLSNTLWSILGSGSGQGNGANNGLLHGASPYSTLENLNSVNNDLVKAQLGVLSSLKNYLSLSGSISPENVLQQLTSQADAVQNIGNLGTGFGHHGQNNFPGKGPSSSSSSSSGLNEPGNTVEYLLPGMMYAEEPLSFQEHSEFLNNAGNGRLAQSGSSGSYSGPSSSIGGSPLVQVIHVPVSSHPMSPHLTRHSIPNTSNIQFPVYAKQKSHGPGLLDSNHGGGSLDAYGGLMAYASASKSSADALKSEVQTPPSSSPDYFSSLSEEERSKIVLNRKSEPTTSNSTKTFDSAVLTSTPTGSIANESKSHITRSAGDKNSSKESSIVSPSTSESTGSESLLSSPSFSSSSSNGSEGKKNLANYVSDGKVNFSYHPILEYIMPNQKTN